MVRFWLSRPGRTLRGFRVDGDSSRERCNARLESGARIDIRRVASDARHDPNRGPSIVVDVTDAEEPPSEDPLDTEDRFTVGWAVEEDDKT